MQTVAGLADTSGTALVSTVREMADAAPFVGPVVDDRDPAVTATGPGDHVQRQHPVRSTNTAAGSLLGGSGYSTGAGLAFESSGGNARCASGAAERTRELLLSHEEQVRAWVSGGKGAEPLSIVKVEELLARSSPHSVKRPVSAPSAEPA